MPGRSSERPLDRARDDARDRRLVAAIDPEVRTGRQRRFFVSPRLASELVNSRIDDIRADEQLLVVDHQIGDQALEPAGIG